MGQKSKQNREAGKWGGAASSTVWDGAAGFWAGLLRRRGGAGPPVAGGPNASRDRGFRLAWPGRGIPELEPSAPRKNGAGAKAGCVAAFGRKPGWRPRRWVSAGGGAGCLTWGLVRPFRAGRNLLCAVLPRATLRLPWAGAQAAPSGRSLLRTACVMERQGRVPGEAQGKRRVALGLGCWSDSRPEGPGLRVSRAGGGGALPGSLLGDPQPQKEGARRAGLDCCPNHAQEAVVGEDLLAYAGGRPLARG